MHDNSLPTTVQCTSIRLLLNLVEVLFSRRADQRSAEPYRVMLASILDAFTAKLSSLHNRLPDLLAHSRSPVAQHAFMWTSTAFQYCIECRPICSRRPRQAPCLGGK